MNNSTNITTNCIPRDETSELFDNIMVALYSLVIVTSVFGNLLVIIIVNKNKSMHSFTNILICNCAFADVVKMIPAIFDVVELLSGGSWYLDLPLCRFWYVCIILSLAITNVTLTVTSFDRSFAVLSPFNKKFSKNMLYIIIPLIWVIALFFASPVIFVIKNVNSTMKGPVYLKLWPPQIDEVKTYQFYTPILFVFLYAVPLVTMTVTYCMIGKRLSRVGKPQNSIIQISVRGRSDSKEDIYELSTQLTKEIDNIALAKKRASRTKGFHKERVIKMLIAIVTVCAITWCPVFSIQFFLLFNPGVTQCVSSLPTWVLTLVFFMSYVNSAINPLVYLGYSKSYRRGLAGLSRISRNHFENFSGIIKRENRRYSSRRS